MLAPLYKARADTLTVEATPWKIFGTSIVTFETEVVNLKNDIPSEK